MADRSIVEFRRSSFCKPRGLLPPLLRRTDARTPPPVRFERPVVRQQPSSASTASRHSTVKRGSRRPGIVACPIESVKNIKRQTEKPSYRDVSSPRLLFELGPRSWRTVDRPEANFIRGAARGDGVLVAPDIDIDRARADSPHTACAVGALSTFPFCA